jgi:hypothetical protein
MVVLAGCEGLVVRVVWVGCVCYKWWVILKSKVIALLEAKK